MLRASTALLSFLMLSLLASCTGRADHMRAMLEQAEWMNRNDSLFTSDSIGKELVRYYDHWWHSPYLRLRAYYMLGCAYRDMGNSPRAIEAYKQAAAQVDTVTAPDSTLNLLMRVHSQMAKIYLVQRLPELEEEELKIAEHLAWQIGDTLSALTFEGYICSILYSNQEYNACIDKALSLHQKFVNSGLYEESFIPFHYCYNSYMEKGDYALAQKYLSLYESCPYFYTQPQRISGGLGILYLFKGQYFLASNQIDSAEYYFRKATILDEKLLLYKGLYQLYEQKHNADSALKYTRLYSDAKEKDYDNARSAAILQIESLYDYSSEKKLADKRELQVNRLTLLLIIAILAVLLIFSYNCYRNERRKRVMNELREKYQIISNELRSKDRDIQELIDKQNTDEGLIARYRYEKEELLIALSRIDQTYKSKISSNQNFDLNKANIIERFRKFRETQSMEYEIKYEHWTELDILVNRVCPAFHLRVNAINHLSTTDYRVCLLVYAGFSSSDIAFYMNSSESFASNTRRRLNKKVFGVEGTPSEFDRKLRLF